MLIKTARANAGNAHSEANQEGKSLLSPCVSLLLPESQARRRSVVCKMPDVNSQSVPATQANLVVCKPDQRTIHETKHCDRQFCTF